MGCMHCTNNCNSGTSAPSQWFYFTLLSAIPNKPMLHLHNTILPHLLSISCITNISGHHSSFLTHKSCIIRIDMLCWALVMAEALVYYMLLFMSLMLLIENESNDFSQDMPCSHVPSARGPFVVHIFEPDDHSEQLKYCGKRKCMGTLVDLSDTVQCNSVTTFHFCIPSDPLSP